MKADPLGARLRHLALVVRDLDAAEPFYASRLGLPPGGRAELSSEDVRVSFVPVGPSQIELLEPLDSEGTIGRWLATRGEGIHHLALEVPDLEAAMARARDAGLRLIDATPRPGAHGTRIAFVHPDSIYGVLVELVQCPAKGNVPRPVR